MVRAGVLAQCTKACAAQAWAAVCRPWRGQRNSFTADSQVFPYSKHIFGLSMGQSQENLQHGKREGKEVFSQTCCPVMSSKTKPYRPPLMPLGISSNLNSWLDFQQTKPWEQQDRPMFCFLCKLALQNRSYKERKKDVNNQNLC